MTHREQSTTNWGKGEEPFGQKQQQQAVVGTSADGEMERWKMVGNDGIWRGIVGGGRDGRIENNGGNSPTIPILDDKAAVDSIFVPFLPQIGTTTGKIKEKGQKGKRRREEKAMEKCRINRFENGNNFLILSFFWQKIIWTDCFVFLFTPFGHICIVRFTFGWFRGRRKAKYWG